MAFHVRLLKHKLLKYTTVKALPHATSAERGIDRISADQLFAQHHAHSSVCVTNESGKRHRQSNQLDDDKYADEDSHLLGRRDPIISPHRGLEQIILLLHQAKRKAVFDQPAKGPHSKEMLIASASEWLNATVPSSCKQLTCYSGLMQHRSLLPVSISDMEAFLFPGTKQCSTKDCIEEHLHLTRIMHPVSHTCDDIMCGVGKRSTFSSTTLDEVTSVEMTVQQETHAVTLLQVGANCTSSNTIPEVTQTLLCSSVSGSDRGLSNSPNKGGPSEEQLLKAKDYLVENVPRFFKEKHNYRIYSPSVIFENNYWGQNKIYRGVNQYVIQTTKYRILAHCVYTQVLFEVLNATVNPHDGSVEVLWRFSGLPQLRTLKFWKFTPFSYRKPLSEEKVWYDGISTFWIGSDGLIYKHKIDRMMADEEVEDTKTGGLAAKLALLLGLVHQPSTADFSSFLMKKSSLAAK